MAVVKSNLLKQIADQYPNYLKKDLNKFLEILLKEITNSLKKGERVEFRDWGIFYTNIQKERISRNPKTGEKIKTPQKRSIHFKMSKKMFNKINNNE